MSVVLRNLLLVATALAATLVCERRAEAYPQFQFTTGTSRCNLCHYSPTGGGLITGWGREEAADSISMWGGNGAWLYEAYEEPEWLKLGVDMRAALLLKDQASDPSFTGFPMQGDLYARFQFLEDWSVYTAIGPRAQVREPGPVLSRFGARELYGMWSDGEGDYVRLGRFLTPFGLRSQDHTWYVRRDLGLYTWDETFTLSGSRVRDGWEAHGSLFAPVPTLLQSGSAKDFGAAGYYERRLGDGDSTSVAVQSRIGVSSEHTRSIVGGWAKHYLEDYDLLLMAEADMGLETFSGSGPARLQLITYAGLTYLPKQGLMFTLSHERYDEDIGIKATARDGVSLNMQFFPWAKWEVMIIGKAERHGLNRRRTSMGMLQLHYYL